MSAGLLHALIAVVYVAGWVLSVPGSMRRWMLGWECPRCHSGSCRTSYHGKDKIRGSMRDRTGKDIAFAIGRAAFWLPRLVALLIGATFRLSGRGVAAAVNKATPLTAPELERRLASQQAEIERLTKQIGDES